MPSESKATPTVDFYMSDFGNIKAPGLVACMGQHILTKVWKWVYTPCCSDTPRQKEFIHAKKCPGCVVEGALNKFAETIWLTGGVLTGIEIDPPAPGTPPQDPRVKVKLGPPIGDFEGE